MKRALPAFLIALVAGAALGGGPRLAPTASYHYDLTNCDGGTNATLPAGDYLVAFKDEGVFLCVGDAGCAAGGQWNPANLAMRQNFGGNSTDSTGQPVNTPLSCRSDGMIGDVSINLIAPGT